MKVINDIVDTLVMKARSIDDVNNVKFVKAYKESLTARNFNGFICVVGIESVSQSGKFIGGYESDGVKGDIYSVKLSLKVYADNETSGEDLGSTALNVSHAFSQADESRIIDSLYIGPITYDNQLQSIYREIVINLDFCLCGDE